MRAIFWILTLSVFIFTSKTAFAGNIQLNEFMANPTDNTEWVELYNPTNQTIDLSDWKIKDGNNLTNDDLTLTGQINPLSFITFDHNRGWLNNTGSESITLFDNSGQTIDSYSYSKTTKGKTYGRQPDGLNWIADLEPSKGSSNGEQTTPTPTPTPSPSPTPTPTKTPSPTAIPKKTVAPTNSSSPTTTPLSSATPIKTSVTSSTQSKNYEKLVYRSASIAGINTGATDSTTPAAAATKVSGQKQTSPLIWAGVVLILSGAGLIGYLVFKNKHDIISR